MATTDGVRVCACGRSIAAATRHPRRKSADAMRRAVIKPRCKSSSGRRALYLEHVLIEPLEVVLHRRAVALRLRWSVTDAAEALIDNQLGRHVVVAQPLIELVGVRQRHALIRRAMLNERRRLRLLDVRDRRRLRV